MSYIQEKSVERGPSVSMVRKPTYLKDGGLIYGKPETGEPIKGFLIQEKEQRPTRELILEARKYLIESYREPTWKKGLEKDYFIIPYLVREADGNSRIIHIGRVRKSGMKMPQNFVTAFDAPEFNLKIIGAENGIATNIEIQDAQGNKLPILAVKYPVSKTISFQDYVYTPFTEALKSPELLAEGRRYMTHMLTRGALDVESMRWIKPEVRDIGPKVISGLMITESMDPSRYSKLSDEEVQKLMHDQVTQFYILLGANDEIAFRCVSGAGARGIVQVIARTFQTLIERFPHEHVHHDFEEGTKHHRSSIILAYGHLQMEFNTYESNKLVHTWIQGPGKEYLPYLLAAGYNSNNVDRTRELAAVLKDYANKKPEEVFARFIGAFSSEGVRNETIPYLKKFAFVMKNHFGYPLPPLPEPIIDVPEEKTLPKKEGKKKK